MSSKCTNNELHIRRAEEGQPGAGPEDQRLTTAFHPSCVGEA